MSNGRLRLIAALCCIFFTYTNMQGQGFQFNCTRDTTIPGCTPVCYTLKAIIPDIKGSSSTYAVNPTSQTPGCFPIYAQPDDPAGTPTLLTIDDRYSSVVNLGFPFTFFGTTYNDLVVSTNGYVSFDITRAGQSSHWTNTPGNLPNTGYDKALIMGPYHDLDPSVGTSPTQRIQYQVFGTAPHRRWILSFYKVPLFSAACNSLIENTHQIVIYESTGIVEVSIFSKQICTGWNSGKALIGMQDFSRTQAIMVPGRTITDPPWGSVGMNESWRFVPNSGASLFRRVELLNLAGTVLSTGTVVPVAGNSFEASFPNTCVPPAPTTYIVRSVYTKIDDPAVEVYGLDTVRIQRTVGVTGTATATSTSCSGANNGTIVAEATTGTAPFTWQLDSNAPVTGASPYTFTNVGPGPHTVTITDGSGCSYPIPVDVGVGPTLILGETHTDALCYQTATGSITAIQPSDGAPAFQYSIDGVTWQASPTFSNLMAGTYTVRVKSSEGCPAQKTVTIGEPALLTASSTNSNSTCDGGTDGRIVVTAGGGTPAYQYSIDGTTFQSSNTFNVTAGTYTVTVKDQNGCTKSFTTTVDLTNNLTFTPQSDVTICEGKSTQLAITSNATQYSWTPATGLSNTTIYNPVASPVVTTQYTVRATLGVCYIDDIVQVNVNAAPVPNAGADGFICYGQTYQLQGSGGTQYKWTPNTWLDNDAVPDPVSSPLRNITYVLSIISDANGCASLTKDTMMIDVTPPIKVKTFPYDTIGHPGDQFMMLAIPSDSDVINYNWTPSGGLSDPTIKNPVVTIGAIGDDVIYQVITSTIAGCKGEGYIRVRSYKGPDIYMPTAFTPNGDGKNDRFTPFPVGIKEIKYFRVFNRWGQMIYTTNQIHQGWDGKIEGKDQPSGVYVWMVEGITKDNKVITKKGTVTLIR